MSAFRAIATVLFLAGLSQTTAQEPGMKLKTIDEFNDMARKADRAAKAKTGNAKVWGNANIPSLVEPKGAVLYEEPFRTLNNWHHEGRGELSQPEPGLMQLNCVGSRQGSAGCMAFCRIDFPDSICIEYDLKALTTNGLVITFVATRGRRGEDMITELPKREGIFADYIYNPNLRCYHVSVSRYNDKGVHTGVSNWRRNPGIFLMAQQPDLCKEPRRWYHVAIVKKGGLLQMAVDGKLAGGFIDPDEIPEPMPSAGKIGFRAIGAKVLAQVKNLRVTAIE